MLRTLGGLWLEGAPFAKRRPLLLLAYLLLEGPASRRFLSELFWPRAQDAHNSLSVALSALRRLGVRVEGEEVVEAQGEVDARHLLRALEEGALERARDLYRGRFLEGADDGLPEELEEWVWTTRERLALSLWEGHRRRARHLRALGEPQEARRLEELALALPGVREVAWEEQGEGDEDPPLDEACRRLFHAIALVGLPQAAAVFKPAPEALETLWQRGFLDGRGEATFRPPLNLEARQTALELARHLPLAQAAPLYRLALPLWRPEDVERGQRALLDQIRQYLEDRPLEALEALASLAPNPEVLLLRSRTLIRLGRFREALGLLEELADTPERSALRGVALYRMGRVEEAKRELPKARAGGPHSQGEAYNLEGLFLLGQGAFREAAEAFGRAAVRFLLAGEEARHLSALNNRAVALAELGQGEEAFSELLALVEGRPVLEARVRLNLGVVRERAGRAEEAEGLYRSSLELARQAGNLEAMGRAWNNLGALYHRTGRSQEAQKAYEEALKLAREARDLVLLAAVLANWAELTGERAFLEEAVRVLEESGQESLARRYRDRLETL